MLKAITTLLALAAFARLSIAVPAAEAKAPHYVYTNWTTGFDQRITGDSSDQQNADNVARDLQFNMAVRPIHDIAESCYGVCASTFPAAIGYNTSDKSPSHTVTRAYANSSVVSFALHSFDFGCDAVDRVLLSNGQMFDELIPVNCSLHATGISRNGRVRTLDLQYVPQVFYSKVGLPAANMMTVTLPTGWEELDTVRFLASTHKNATTPYAGTVYFDTFKYTVKNITTAA